MPSQDHERELREAICSGRAVIVAGTGVSIAASRDPVTNQSHPEASWVGLLQNGLKWLRDHDLMEAADADAHLRSLYKNPQTPRLIAIAADITTGMGGPASAHFKKWLTQTSGDIKAVDREVLDALEAIRQHGNLLATTNYDGLLLDDSARLTPITWKDPDEFIRAVRDWDTTTVLFLHGYWRQPDSVVLDWDSYEQIARDDHHRDNLAAIWKTTTWVYVGCGINGLSDPDFGLLMHRYAARSRQAGHWDYCLVRNSQRHEFQSYFNQKNLNIRAISFGKEHEDLAAYLRLLLPAPATPPPLPAADVAADTPAPIPSPPAFYAEADYIGRQTFIGRAAQLRLLDNWARPSDPTNVLLFEAIGGNGKSMLTWEWVRKYAPALRTGKDAWAGRFWYSFYEKGAVMRQFCQHALAYMTGRPLKEFESRHTADMRGDLLAQLHQKPWLLILDGLERVLVAYHRIDAAEVRDEEVNRPTDKVLDRNPCDAIRDEDTDLLRALATAKPSKILISSRLVPRALLNPAGLPMPGVKPLALPGLDEADAEALLRSCDVRGTSADIRYYLTTYCANHPLVIGVLAGLINSPGPHRGNFDTWAADPEYGAKLNLASLDLIQSRNHILLAAIDALEPASRQLLATLALLSSAVDYQTVAAFNPHLPTEPAEVKEPAPPEKRWSWEKRTDDEKAKLRGEYDAALAERRAYEQAMEAWRNSPAVREAPKKLAKTMADLEQRRLLQYDDRTKRYDLHPVVRGVAAGAMTPEDKDRYGQRVVDHFSSQPHNPYEQAKTMEDVESGLHVVRTLLKLGKYQEAADAYQGSLSDALFFNLEAYVEVLSILRPFVSAGWDKMPMNLSAWDFSGLANDAAIALDYCGEYRKALGAYEATLRAVMETKRWSAMNVHIRNISRSLIEQNFLAKAVRVTGLALDLATVRADDEETFMSRLFLFVDHARLGQWQAAEATWRLVDPMGRDWSRIVYRKGVVEHFVALFKFWQSALLEEQLTIAATLAEHDGNRVTLRDLHRLRGDWRLEQGEWALAAASFNQALTMARERRLLDQASETGLALAKFHLGQLMGDDARAEAERLGQLRSPSHRTLALLWLAIGDQEQAAKHALAAYKRAWADGEPYVHRYDLTKTTELLERMGVPIPALLPYDPASDEPFAWEADVRAAIEKIRAEKEAKQKADDAKPE